MLYNKKHPPSIDKGVTVPLMEDAQDVEDQIKLDRALVAEARLVEILTTIVKNKNDRVVTVGRLKNDFNKIFKSHLSNVLMGDPDPHHEALKMQESLWGLYGGYTLELLRLKCITIGYNPDVFVDGVDPKYATIQL